MLPDILQRDLLHRSVSWLNLETDWSSLSGLGSTYAVCLESVVLVTTRYFQRIHLSYLLTH